jgi:hypothetical protein
MSEDVSDPISLTFVLHYSFDEENEVFSDQFVLNAIIRSF